MLDDLFQEPQSDLFQAEYLPGRGIPEHDLTLWLQPTECVRELKFLTDCRNTSPWITVIYNSFHHAEKAAVALPKLGLNVFYPKCRYKEKEVQASCDSTCTKRRKTNENPPAFVSAYGRYLFIQLPEDQDTFENIEITERMLGGRFNANGVSEIMSIDGEYSLTRHQDIVANAAYHIELIEKTDPKKVLRFSKDETVLVTKGNLLGYFVVVQSDIYMYFKLNSKTEVSVGATGARHYVKVGDLQKHG